MNEKQDTTDYVLTTQEVASMMKARRRVINDWVTHGTHQFPPPDLPGRPHRWFYSTIERWKKRKVG